MCITQLLANQRRVSFMLTCGVCVSTWISDLLSDLQLELWLSICLTVSYCRRPPTVCFYLFRLSSWLDAATCLQTSVSCIVPHPSQWKGSSLTAWSSNVMRGLFSPRCGPLYLFVWVCVFVCQQNNSNSLCVCAHARVQTLEKFDS